MYNIAEFYDYCKTNDIDIMPYIGFPSTAATVRDGKWYCVVIDFSKIKTIREFRGITMHEYGHLRTGCLHKAESPYQLVAQAEYRANADSFQRYLPVEMLLDAMRKGYTETWQLAEWFDLPEEDIKKALHYWTQCKGIDFNLLN